MTRLLLVLSFVALAGCDKSADTQGDQAKQDAPKIKPNLPAVPTLPPPPHPIKLEDDSHSVFGVRHRTRHTMDTETAVTGYIVELHEPPLCKERDKTKCPVVKAPHIWIADTADEGERANQLIVVGYADNQAQIERAKKRPKKPVEGMVAIPTDFAVGNKVKINGRFTRLAAGFNSSNGLLEYLGHETLEKAPK